MSDFPRLRRRTERLINDLGAYGDAGLSSLRVTTPALAKHLAETNEALLAILEWIEAQPDPNAVANLPTDEILQARADYNRDHAAELFPELERYNERWGLWKDDVYRYIVFTPYGYVEDPEQ